MSNITKGKQLDELSNQKLAQYKTAAAADASKADSEGDYKRGNKRFSGINKATMKQFDNDSKGVTEAGSMAQQAAIAINMKKHHKKPKSEDVEEGSSADYRQFFDKEDAAMKKTKSSFNTQAPSFRSKQEYENWVEKNKLAKHDLTRQKDPEEKVGMEEANNNYHANRTGFSRGPRDDERHDLDVQHSPQVWGLKIKGKVWNKNGKDVTFTSQEAAIKSMNSILKMHPDLQGKIGLVTKGGQQGVNEGSTDNSSPYLSDEESMYLDSVVEEYEEVGSSDFWHLVKEVFGQERYDQLADDAYEAWVNSELNEVSRDTLASYVSKASDARGHRNLSTKKVDNRYSGVATAVKKLDKKNEQGLEEGENWSKHNHKRVGGMSDKSVKSYRRSHPGSKIQTAVTTKPSKLKKGSKAAKRRKSFCARMKGMKKHRTSAKTAHDPNSNINKSLRRWHCESVEELQQLVMIAEQKVKQAKLEQESLKQDLWEEWSQKYKSSINCSHPKGFSQKAHCAGKKKHNESMEVMEMVCEDCGMCQTHGDHSRDTLDEACWTGYHKEGNKKMFGKTYPNCVKNEDVAEGEGNKYGSQENWDSLRKDIKSQYPYKKGTTVTVPHKGKLVNGKIVRYEAGGGGYSPAYVVDIGEYESIMVEPNKVRIGVAEGTANDVTKLFTNAYDPVYANLQRVALLAMQGRQQEAAGLLQRVIKDADPVVQKKIIDAVNNIKPVTINGRIADSSTIDKSKQHNDWIINTFIPWVQSQLGQQGVAEGSLEEVDRRGFLKGMGAAALAGAAGVSQANQQQDLGDGFVLTTVDVVGESCKAVMDTQSGLIVMPNRRANGSAIIRSQARFLMIKDGKIAGTSMSVGPGTMAALQKAGLLSKDVDEGYRVVPDINRERYTERPGLEGPFRTNHGKVVYYDKREGKYYDPDSDMYISHDDYQAMNEGKKIDQSKPRNFVAKNAKMGGAGEHKDKKKAMKQGEMKHKNKEVELAEVVAESSIMQGLKKV